MAITQNGEIAVDKGSKLCENVLWRITKACVILNPNSGNTSNFIHLLGQLHKEHITRKPK